MLTLATLLGGVTLQLAAQPAGLHSTNVWGDTLERCDRPAYFQAHPEHNDRNYPVTGYYRNNECTASAADAGAHFVCVRMPNGTTASGETYSMFWTETGQASSPEVAAQWPKPGPWCICMWAFARMFQQHPDFIDMLQCDATNEWVIENYQLNQPSQASALHAVCTKCGVANNANAAQKLRDKCLAAHAKFGTTPTLGRRLSGELETEPPVQTCDSENATEACDAGLHRQVKR